MWWNQPLLKGFRPLLPMNVLDVLARAYSVVQVGGVSGNGAERGRNFEQLFYDMCSRRGVHLSERAGSRTAAEQQSASGFGHEMDGATRSPSAVTHWELKHLTSELPKNELLIFNGKGQDFLYGSTPLFKKIPIFRFLLSGHTIRDDCRNYAAMWGIMVIEPDRLPLPLLYQAVATGLANTLTETDCSAVRELVSWGCRPLQCAIQELATWCSSDDPLLRCGVSAIHAIRSLLAMQEQIGGEVLDCLDEQYPEWVDDTACQTWTEVDGW